MFSLVGFLLIILGWLQLGSEDVVDVPIILHYWSGYYLSSSDFLVLGLFVLQQHILVKIDDHLVHINPDLFMVGSKLNIERMKVEVACLYYLILPSEKREKGSSDLSFPEIVCYFATKPITFMQLWTNYKPTRKDESLPCI